MNKIIYHKNCMDGVSSAFLMSKYFEEIAAHYGGGGHRNAAGVQLELEELFEIINSSTQINIEKEM